MTEKYFNNNQLLKCSLSLLKIERWCDTALTNVPQSPKRVSTISDQSTSIFFRLSYGNHWEIKKNI